jgi:hypothetical protein
MTPTPREIVFQALNFEDPCRAPREFWSLPVAEKAHPETVRYLEEHYPADFDTMDGFAKVPAPVRGEVYAIGKRVDEWGCEFVNIQEGVVGEVRDPQVKDWARDAARVHVPREWLAVDRDGVNRACAATDKFTRCGCTPRPFEQLQFIRGTVDLMMDLMDPSPEFLAFMRGMHRFYCELLEVWAKTDVDALNFMDDWGSQQSLLIPPPLWREYFKPMYRDYCQIARAAGKKIFMHSDGHILEIFPDLVEIGVDAVNAQIFCMGLEKLAPFAGKITFRGEIDRQHLLPNGTLADIDQAVRKVHSLLWRKGGCLAQCEFGPGARPENVIQVYKSWDAIFSVAKR